MFRIILGFIIGVIISRNAQALAAPVASAVVAGAMFGLWATYRFGNKDKNTAVATAVAIATANARAEATAQAQSVINLYGIPLKLDPSGSDAIMVSDSDTDRIIDHGHASHQRIDQSHGRAPDLADGSGQSPARAALGHFVPRKRPELYPEHSVGE